MAQVYPHPRPVHANNKNISTTHPTGGPMGDVIICHRGSSWLCLFAGVTANFKVVWITCTQIPQHQFLQYFVQVREQSVFLYCHLLVYGTTSNHYNAIKVLQVGQLCGVG